MSFRRRHRWLRRLALAFGLALCETGATSECVKRPARSSGRVDSDATRWADARPET
jgi:hypothetical protein